MNGNNFIVSWGSSGTMTPIAGGRSDRISTDCDIIPISSPTQGGWEDSIAGRKSWSLQVSWLVLNDSDCANLLNVGNTYTITFTSRDGSEGVSGTAILKTCEIDAARGSIVSGSFQFVGKGPLAAIAE